MEDDLFDFARRYFAFGNHPQADRWAGYSEGARRGALAHARRQFDAEQALALSCFVLTSACPPLHCGRFTV